MRAITINAEPRRGITFVSISGILWGTIGIAAQTIYHQSDVGSLAIGFYRLALGFPIVALACCLIVGKDVFRVHRRHYVQMILIGVMLALYQASYFSAIGYIGVTMATIITLCTAPVVVSLASVIFLKETLTQYTLGGLTLAVIGTGLLIGAPGAIPNLNHLFLGVGLSFVSATGYAIVALMGRSLAGACHPIHSTAVSFSIGALVLLPFVAFSGQAIQYSGEVWGLLLYLGLVPTALGYIFFFLGVNFISAPTASILTMLEPLVATFLAWLLFSERLSLIAIIGAVLLFMAIAVLYKGEESMSCNGG